MNFNFKLKKGELYFDHNVMEFCIILDVCTKNEHSTSYLYCKHCGYNLYPCKNEFFYLVYYFRKKIHFIHTIHVFLRNIL
jgi:hypothetical protein